MDISHKVTEIKHRDGIIHQVAVQEDCAIPSGDMYHKYGNNWWSNPECPYAYKYLTLDTLYPKEYFNAEHHPNSDRADEMIKYMQDTYYYLFGKHFISVLELGSGGGEMTAQFAKYGLEYVTVEGTSEGCKRLVSVGISPDRILQRDLRKMENLDRKFDLVMCTEVAEHLEPPFASRIVELCTQHSDVVWWSAADPHRPAHYQHMNEQEPEVWDNLFAFYEYDRYYKPPIDFMERAKRVYFNKKMLLKG